MKPPQKIVILRRTIFCNLGLVDGARNFCHTVQFLHHFCSTARIRYMLIESLSLSHLYARQAVAWCLWLVGCHKGGLWPRPIVNYHRTLIGTHFDHWFYINKASSTHLALFMYQMKIDIMAQFSGGTILCRQQTAHRTMYIITNVTNCANTLTNSHRSRHLIKLSLRWGHKPVCCHTCEKCPISQC